MKICLIHNLFEPYARGGAEQVVKIAIDFVLSKGHKVILITSTPNQAEIVEKKSFLCKTVSLTSSSKPGSKIGVFPALRRLIFSSLLSTQVTKWPSFARQEPVVKPTYTEPIIAIFITTTFYRKNKRKLDSYM